jgi:hypothetical protein
MNETEYDLMAAVVRRKMDHLIEQLGDLRIVVKAQAHEVEALRRERGQLTHWLQSRGFTVRFGKLGCIVKGP